ncbi:hypothetical protein OMW55_03950 [Sphingomonas sp. BN140010]|uniref:Uncharacterized protein n=1 Tax=Sphingomonas arvum TaxID=2992113 RepID=A0ABT3JD02_9SPHN|nr:hypothetical protein [Sphingomonas sp. BN140010]MCW3796958.1 hypothetical protein [Sphingomonas sp. BN140010]
MASTNNGLPEGTDAVIEGGGTGGSGGTAGRSGTVNQGGSPSTATNSTGGRTSMTAGDTGTDSLITGQTTDQGRSLGGGSGGSGSGGGDTTGSGGGSDGSNKSGIRGIISTAGTKAKDEATSRARGFVGQGLTSSSATLGNVAGIIEDTVEQIGERLGPQYADYARTASQTIQRYATTLENKDPDELVDDVRGIVRKSPSVALGAAAIIGFGLARLLRAGISESASGSTGTSSDSSSMRSTGGSSSAGSTGGSSTSVSTGASSLTGATSGGASTGTTGGTGGSLAGRTQPKA